MTGGSVSRTLTNILYKTKIPKYTDFDFIVSRLNKKIKVPRGWQNLKNSYGNPKLRKENSEIDIFPITNILSIKRRHLRPSIKNYLSGTPMSVQSIVFDLQSRKIIGSVGLKSLLSKKIWINDITQFKIASQKGGFKKYEKLTRSAKSMNFKAVLPK